MKNSVMILNAGFEYAWSTVKAILPFIATQKPEKSSTDLDVVSFPFQWPPIFVPVSQPERLPNTLMPFRKQKSVYQQRSINQVLSLHLQCVWMLCVVIKNALMNE